MGKSKNYPPNLKGMRRHGRSGHTVNSSHFTGQKKGKKIRCKGKGLTQKMRRMKRGKHVNKYKKGDSK
jgi:hypothetical protein